MDPNAAAATPRNTTAQAGAAKGCLTKRITERHGQSHACNAAPTVTAVLE